MPDAARDCEGDNERGHRGLDVRDHRGRPPWRGRSFPAHRRRRGEGAHLAVLRADRAGQRRGLAEFGEAALRENLENLDWLDEVARAHHYVIDAAARLFPLLPVRLATVYSGDAAVSAALAEHNGQLLDVLRRVGGRVEWGVKAYPAQEPEAAPESGKPESDKGGTARQRGTSPARVRARTRGPGGGAGLAYLKRRRTQLTAAREAKATAVNAVRAVHADLTAKATDTRLYPAQAAQLSGVRQPMLLNAAYLLDPGDA